MVAGASAAGARAMTSSSSPGISLKQEGISSLAAHELPSLIVNIMRGGPGLGNIRPSQGDYFQATKGGGHGDYRIITYLADDAEIVIIAYGTAARVAKGAIKRLRQEGLKVGLFRPITLWPYPAPALARLAGSCRKFLVFEMSTGQMVEDVNLALQGRAEVKFYRRPGGLHLSGGWRSGRHRDRRKFSTPPTGRKTSP